MRAERGDVWRLILNARGVRDVVTARVLVNAAGAWVETVAETVLRQVPLRRLRLDKGSHIVVPRLYDHDRAYILQAADGRVVFAIPFQRDFTLIGTTDQSFAGDPAAVAPSKEEIDYLCGVINEYFRAAIGAADVVWAYAGVRSLYDDGARKPQDIGRDYALVLDKSRRQGAAADGLWRQAYDFPASGRGRACAAVAFFSALAAMDREQPVAGRRFCL